MTQLSEIIHKKGSHFVFFLLWFVKGTFKTQPSKWVIVALTISLGISLAVAINIVNKSAITEFNHSTNILRGGASFQIKGKTGFFNELFFIFHFIKELRALSNILWSFSSRFIVTLNFDGL